MVSSTVRSVYGWDFAARGPPGGGEIQQAKEAQMNTPHLCPETCGDGDVVLDVTRCAESNDCRRRRSEAALTSRFGAIAEDAAQEVRLRAHRMAVDGRHGHAGVVLDDATGHRGRLWRREKRQAIVKERCSALRKCETGPEEVGANRLWVEQMMRALAAHFTDSELVFLVATYDPGVAKEDLWGRSASPSGRRATRSPSSDIGHVVFWRGTMSPGTDGDD